MQDKYKAKVWDEDKQEWTEQEILVAHLVDEKESQKRKKQKIKHFLGNALSFIVECFVCVFNDYSNRLYYGYYWCSKFYIKAYRICSRHHHWLLACW